MESDWLHERVALAIAEHSPFVFGASCPHDETEFECCDERFWSVDGLIAHIAIESADEVVRRAEELGDE